MTEMADIAIKVPSDQTNYIQEMHIAVGQLICGIVEEYFFKKLIYLFSKSSAILSNDFSYNLDS